MTLKVEESSYAINEVIWRNHSEIYKIKTRLVHHAKITNGL